MGLFCGLICPYACARSRAVIYGLLRKKQRLENELGIVKERDLKVWSIEVVLWMYLNRFQERVEDLSFICEDLEVRGELLKKRTNVLEDEVVMRRGREKKLWVALVLTWLFWLCLLYLVW